MICLDIFHRLGWVIKMRIAYMAPNPPLQDGWLRCVLHIWPLIRRCRMGD